MTGLLFNDTAACCMGPEQEGCMCGREERALRAISASQYRQMTSAEREWCRLEILRVEGYDESDCNVCDSQLASTTLSAWQDYCRDKGLL